MRIFVYSLKDIKMVIRGCAIDEYSAYRMCRDGDEILYEKGRPDEKYDCSVCNSDGCNEATHYGPAAFLIAFPVAFAKFSSFWILFSYRWSESVGLLLNTVVPSAKC